MRAKNYCVLSLCFAILLSFFSGCAGNASETRSGLGNGWEIQSSMALQYAKNFSVDYYNGGYALLSLSDGSRFLVVPENQAVPDGIDADIVVLKQPIHHI
jgi:iron complex transport system substrate-binding protein